jgi:hypothetical protein
LEQYVKGCWLEQSEVSNKNRTSHSHVRVKTENQFWIIILIRAPINMIGTFVSNDKKAS